MSRVVGSRPEQTGRFQTGRVLTLSAGHAVHDTYAAFLSPLLPVFIENLALSKTEAGLLATFYQLPSLLQPLIGHLFDRADLRVLMILAPAIGGTLMSLVGVAPSYAVLALLLLAAGLNSAAIHSVGPVMTGNISGSRLGRGMGVWMVGGELGRTLGPITVVTAVQVFTLRGLPWLIGGGLLASALLYLSLRDVPVRAPGAPQSLPWRAAIRMMGPFLIPLLGILTVRAFIVSSLSTYLPVFLRDEGADLWFAGASLSIMEGAGVVGALGGGALSDRLGRRRVLFFSLLLTSLLMFLFLSVDGWYRLPILLLLGLTGLSVTPVIMAAVQESFPANRALANGVYMAMNFGIRAGAILVLGAIGDAWGMRPAYAVSAILGLLGMPFLLLLPRERR